MPISKVSLTEAIKAIGKADIYAGDATTASGLLALGATEGDIEVEELETYNDLMAPEYTGDAVHDRKVLQGGARITAPLILTAAAYDKLSSLGDGTGGGHSTQQAAVTTTILVIPQSEVGAGLSFSAGVWAPAAPVHAVWLWRAVIEPDTYAFHHGDGGKTIREVSFLTLFDDAKPEGHKLWTRGDPDAHAIVIAI